MSKHPSIIWFTAHKCASVYMTQVLEQLAQEVGMKHIDYEGSSWFNGKNFFQELMDNPAENYFQPRGYIYGAFRGFFYGAIPSSIENIEKYKVVLMLRDPRDVLTSLYFSTAYSHDIPECYQSEMLVARNKAVKTLINDYVLDKEQQHIYETYEYYCKKLLNQPNVLFLRYEDMVNDFENWLNAIGKWLDLELSKAFLDNLVKTANFEITENIHAHKRQVKPGDHRRKLKVSTIRKLNQQYRAILKTMGYVTDMQKEDLDLSQLMLHKSRENLMKKS